MTQVEHLTYATCKFVISDRPEGPIGPVIESTQFTPRSARAVTGIGGCSLCVTRCGKPALYPLQKFKHDLHTTPAHNIPKSSDRADLKRAFAGLNLNCILKMFEMSSHASFAGLCAQSKPKGGKWKAWILVSGQQMQVELDAFVLMQDDVTGFF